jgi:hypothetical protein
MDDGLEVNVEKTKYIFMSLHHNADQNDYIKKAYNNSLENIEKLPYFGRTVTC